MQFHFHFTYPRIKVNFILNVPKLLTFHFESSIIYLKREQKEEIPNDVSFGYQAFQ